MLMDFKDNWRIVDTMWDLFYSYSSLWHSTNEALIGTHLSLILLY